MSELRGFNPDQETRSLDEKRRAVVEYLETTARALTSAATADRKKLGDLIGLTKAILRVKHGYAHDERIQAVLTRALRDAEADVHRAAAEVIQSDREAVIATVEDDEATRYDPKIERDRLNDLLRELGAELTALLAGKAETIKKARGPAVSDAGGMARDRVINPPDVYLAGVAAAIRRGDPVTPFAARARDILEDVGGPETARAIALLEELTDLEEERRQNADDESVRMR